MGRVKHLTRQLHFLDSCNCQCQEKLEVLSLLLSQRTRVSELISQQTVASISTWQLKTAAGIPTYNEYQGYGGPPCDIGAVGDIYIDVTPERHELLAKTSSDVWRRWLGPWATIKHPRHPTFYLQVNLNSKNSRDIGWYPANSMVIMPPAFNVASTPHDILKFALERRASDGDSSPNSSRKRQSYNVPKKASKKQKLANGIALKMADILAKSSSVILSQPQGAPDSRSSVVRVHNHITNPVVEPADSVSNSCHQSSPDLTVPVGTLGARVDYANITDSTRQQSGHSSPPRVSNAMPSFPSRNLIGRNAQTILDDSEIVSGPSDEATPPHPLPRDVPVDTRKATFPEECHHGQSSVSETNGVSDFSVSRAHSGRNSVSIPEVYSKAEDMARDRSSFTMSPQPEDSRNEKESSILLADLPQLSRITLQGLKVPIAFSHTVDEATPTHTATNTDTEEPLPQPSVRLDREIISDDTTRQQGEAAKCVVDTQRRDNIDPKAFARSLFVRTVFARHSGNTVCMICTGRSGNVCTLNGNPDGLSSTGSSISTNTDTIWRHCEEAHSEELQAWLEIPDAELQTLYADLAARTF